MIDATDVRMGARRFQALVENLGDLVTVHDSQGRIQYATPSTTRLLGYPEQQLLGKNGFELIHPDDMVQAQAAFELMLDGRNQLRPTEYRVQRSDGVWLDVETVGSNFLEDPVVRGIVLTSRVITDRKRHERQLVAITGVASALRSASTRADMLPILLDQVIHLLSLDGAALTMREPVTGDIIVELGMGCAQPMTGLRLKAGEGISGYVIQTGEAYRADDALADPLFAALDRIDPSAQKRVAAACLPLKASNETIGTLWAEKTSAPGGAPARIDDEQLQLLTAIAEMSANAIHRATLNEQTQLRLHRLMVLQTIDLAISRSTDLQMTLNLLLGEITSRLRIDAADVLLIDSSDGSLRSAASRGFTTGFIARLQPRFGKGITPHLLVERRTIYLKGVSEENLPPEVEMILEAEGCRGYCCLPLMATGKAVGVLELFQRAASAYDAEWIDYLEGLAAHVALAIEKVSLIQDLQRTNSELVRAYDGVIEGWSRALALRDHETLEHTSRVTRMTMRLARLVGVNASQLTDIRRGAMLHDIGKIGLPDAVLLKAGPLTAPDWEVVRRHPTNAYELMEPIDYLRPAVDIPYCHHERWDGSGYPRGLHGGEIPLAAQIFSIVDVYDALTSDRPYRPAWSREKAIEYIRQQAGKDFSPELVEVFVNNLQSIDCADVE